MNQWKERIQEFHLMLSRNYSSKRDIHNKDIVIGMLQSLSKKNMKILYLMILDLQ